VKLKLSTRAHVSLSMASLVVSLLLAAALLGLVPDRDGALRSARTTLAEVLAADAMALIASRQPRLLESNLELVVGRNPDVRSVGVRTAEGDLLVRAGEHARLWSMDGDAAAQVVVPLRLDGRHWGQLELLTEPAGVMGGRQWFLLVVFCGAGALAVFYLYLGKALRHLDPSQAVPGRVRNALDTLAEGLLVLDREGRVVLANQSLAGFLGRPAEGLAGLHADELGFGVPALHEQDTRELPWARTLADGQVHRDERLSLAQGDGAERMFLVNCAPVLGGSGRTNGVLVSLDEITQIEAQKRELAVAKESADLANQTKSLFLANMSHEIRTPMNAILGFTELLKRGKLRDETLARRYLDTIHSSGTHLLQLINDILDLSKVEAGHLEVERIPCAAQEIAREVVDILGIKAQESGVGFGLRIDGRIPVRITADPVRLRQILTNLAGNALKFTREGRVEIVLRMETASLLAIDITDTGIGIEPDRLELIFEPFVQADQSVNRRFGGTGLGLSISRRFARALGGDIVARSVPGSGSTFTVTLEPGAIDGVAWIGDGDLAAPVPVTGAREARWVFPAARILIVDDGEENRELLRALLDEYGFDLEEATNGAEALERVRRGGIDLVLMDVQMPVMDGLTATRRLREEGCATPIVALTANVMAGAGDALTEAGFTVYEAKPVVVDSLLSTLAGLFGAARAADEPDVPAPAPAAATSPPGVAAEAEPEQLPRLPSRLATNPRFHRAIRSFGARINERLGEMRVALAAGEWTTLSELGHWLKGAGGTVGFDCFTEPATRLEAGARAGDAALCARELESLAAIVARLELPHDGQTATQPAA
jgi:PAS domain S-box-containing protein